MDIVKIWNKVVSQNENKLYLVMKEDKTIIKEVESDKVVKIIENKCNK